MNLLESDLPKLREMMGYIGDIFELNQITDLQITMHTFPSTACLAGGIGGTAMTNALVCVVQVGNLHTIFDQYGNGYKLHLVEHAEIIDGIREGKYPTQQYLRHNGLEDTLLSLP